MNAAPIAGDDLIAIHQDQSLQLARLLANDSDPDGDAITFESWQPPSVGTIDDASGQLIFTPPVGFTGLVTWQYVVTDSVATSETATAEIYVNEAVDLNAARSQLLSGVTALGDPGGPGHMVAFGPTAFSVANYPGEGIERPLVGASTLGDGRVVLLPDHQWLSTNRFADDPQTLQFFDNAITWASPASAATTRVVVYNNTTDADHFATRGFASAINSTTANLQTDLQSADVLYAPWLGNNVSDDVLNTVRDFVRNGGGLIVADYGIGYQWWWNRETADIPVNRLLRPAGLAVTKDWPDSGSQSVTAATGQVTEQQILDALVDSSGLSGEQKDTVAAVYASVHSVLPEGDTLLAELDQSFGDRIDSIRPTPATPVSDAFEKALLLREADLIRDLPPAQVIAHRTADDLFGVVPVGAPRMSGGSHTIDTAFSGLHATGFYAAPGETVMLQFAPEMVGQGFRVRINNHVDSVTGRSSWLRFPRDVSRSFPIDSTNIEVANAFGGTIFIDLGGDNSDPAPDLGSFEITVDGAVETPLFELGQTTNADWVADIRDRPGLMAEFVSPGLSFSVPSDWIRDLDDPEALMTFWNDVVQRLDYVGGYDGLRTASERINYDIQISVGLLHAGYPIQGPTSYGRRIVDLAGLRESGDWGWFHELGHEMQARRELSWGYNNPWTFDGDTEVTVNIFANAALEFATEDPPPSGWGYSVDPLLVMQRTIHTTNDPNASTFEQRDPYPFYFQLADGPWGWEGYRDVIGSYVDDQQNDPGGLPSGNAEEKDQWLIRWSEATGHDMTTYMVDHWGLEVSQTAIDQVAAMNLPAWLPLAVQESTPLLASQSNVVDFRDLGLGIDGVSTLTDVTAGQNIAVTARPDGTHSLTPVQGFVGDATVMVTYRSSVGNEQTFEMRLPVQERGAVRRFYDNINGTYVANLTSSAKYPDSPDDVQIASSFTSPSGRGNAYGVQVDAYLIPPVTGNYRFWIASDDAGQLLLSDDENEANLNSIASVAFWTSFESFDQYASQRSVEIPLVAGQRYWMRALMKEGGGGDHLSVAWTGPDIGVREVIDDRYLVPVGSIMGAGTDFGSAASPYTSSMVDGGAFHTAYGPRLGSRRTVETDANLLDDDNDGVTFGPVVVGQSEAAVNVVLHNADSATLDAWIDFNRDGVWDAGEKVFDGRTINQPLQTLNYALPSGLDAGDLVARFRVSENGVASPLGDGGHGEVEDHVVPAIIAPTITAIDIGGPGNVQRSAVTSIDLTLNHPVTNIGSDVFQVTQIETGQSVPIAVATDGNVVTLTFIGGDLVNGGSGLVDGNYQLSIDGDAFMAAGVAVDVDGDGVHGGNRTYEASDGFFRKYGDMTGDQIVDLLDFGMFRRAFGTSDGQSPFVSELDANFDNVIDLIDFGSFRSAFGT